MYIEIILQLLVKHLIYTRLITKDQRYYIFWCIISGLDHCHKHKIYHRDIKPENILLGSDGNVKLCDFSLACHDNEALLNEVVTIWYRAPELLLGSCTYNSSIDIWAACCVLLEMKQKQPLFFTDNPNDTLLQLRTIISKCGLPTQDEMKFMYGHEVDMTTFMDKWNIDKIIFEDTFLNKTFVYTYTKRPSAEDILNKIKYKQVNLFIEKTERIDFTAPPSDWTIF